MEPGIIRFGSGRVFMDGKEVVDLRDASVSWSRDVAEYRGGKSYVQDAAIKSHSLTLKASTGQADPELAAAVMGAVVTVGHEVVVTESFDTAPGTATVTLSGGTFGRHLGITHPTYGRMKSVASNPALGEFSVNTSTGVYTFNASETGNASVTWTRVVAASGSTATISNADKAKAPRVEIFLWAPYDATRSSGLLIPQFVITKWEQGSKQDDFLDPGALEGFAVADSTGVLAKEFRAY